MAVARAHPALHEDRATESGTSSCAMDSKHGTGDPACECSSWASPTTSSQILLDTPPRVPLRHTSRQATTASVRQVGRQARHHAADPYARSRPVIREASRPVDADRSVRTPAEFPQRAHSRGRRLHAGFLAVQCSPPPGAVQPAGDRLPIGAPLRVV
jgi:hypothetical protein